MQLEEFVRAFIVANLFSLLFPLQKEFPEIKHIDIEIN